MSTLLFGVFFSESADRWVFVVTSKMDRGDGYSWMEAEHVIPCPVRKVCH